MAKESQSSNLVWFKVCHFKSPKELRVHVQYSTLRVGRGGSRWRSCEAWDAGCWADGLISYSRRKGAMTGVYVRTTRLKVLVRSPIGAA